MGDLTDEQLDKWGEDYDKWSKENDHLPNLQKSSAIIPRMKQQRDMRKQQNTSNSISPDTEARFKRIEQKLDKLIKHLGVK